MDILIKNKYVIEVNGGSHYLYNIETGETQLNLKTKFRDEMLPLMGYHVLNMSIDEFNEGSFEMLDKISRWIQ